MANGFAPQNASERERAFDESAPAARMLEEEAIDCENFHDFALLELANDLSGRRCQWTCFTIARTLKASAPV